MTTLDYPGWLRVEHWVNVLFVTLLIRSGIEILAAHPKLYRRSDSTPGTEWGRFTRKIMPTTKLYDTLDEEESYSPVVALPGRRNLGMGRHWHFVSIIGWMLTGASYYALLFATGQWHRYIPYSWSIFPQAWNDILSYMSFELPPLLPGQPMDAVQKLTYCAVIFGLAPFQIASGAAQSPAVEARFPWYVRLWGGRQAARTAHFWGLAAFCVFIVVHLVMVAWWGWRRLNALMIFGTVTNLEWALVISLALIGAVVVAHIAATIWSLRRPRSVQKALGYVISRFRLAALRPMRSRQHYPARKISGEHRVNGKPPDCDDYKVLAVHDFADWRLTIGGLVERPRELTLADLRSLREQQTQTVLHNCIQGWSSFGQWSGVPMAAILDLVRPMPEARHVCLWTMQRPDRDEPAAEGGGQFYEVLDLELARHPQCLLALELNGQPLPIKHGAPLRLRIENQVGFKMAKWIDRIEFVADYHEIGAGMGGWREDHVYYDKDVAV